MNRRTIILPGFIDFLKAAEGDANFAAEIPAFVAQIRSLFEPWPLAEYLDKPRQTKPVRAEDDDDPEEGKVDRQLERWRPFQALRRVKRARRCSPDDYVDQRAIAGRLR